MRLWEIEIIKRLSEKYGESSYVKLPTTEEHSYVWFFNKSWAARFFPGRSILIEISAASYLHSTFYRDGTPAILTTRKNKKLESRFFSKSGKEISSKEYYLG